MLPYPLVIRFLAYVLIHICSSIPFAEYLFEVVRNPFISFSPYNILLFVLLEISFCGES